MSSFPLVWQRDEKNQSMLSLFYNQYRAYVWEKTPMKGERQVFMFKVFKIYMIDGAEIVYNEYSSVDTYWSERLACQRCLEHIGL